MNRVPYEFATIRYVHDPVLEEALNVGVAMFIPSQGQFLMEVDDTFHRLSQAFPGFDGTTYRRSVRELHSLAAAVTKEIQRELKASGDLFNRRGIKSLTDATTKALPDAELSLRIGRVSAGLTDDPRRELSTLFQRFVKSSQAAQKDPARDEEQIWHDFRRVLAPKVEAKLAPFTARTKVADVEFEHTFVNSSVHAIQPLSFDLLSAETINGKAARWVGWGVALHEERAIERVYFILGRPVRADNTRAYDRAKDFLDTMPLAHEIIEEGQEESFARNLMAFMKDHGLIDNDK